MGGVLNQFYSDTVFLLVFEGLNLRIFLLHRLLRLWILSFYTELMDSNNGRNVQRENTHTKARALASEYSVQVDSQVEKYLEPLTVSMQVCIFFFFFFFFFDKLQLSRAVTAELFAISIVHTFLP